LTEAMSVNRGLRARTVAIVTTLALAVGLLAAPLASGAADPVSGGTFKLKLNSGFKKQLKKNGVKMKPRSFKIKSTGSLDPTTGTGTVSLKGKLKFTKGGKKAVFKNLKASAGKLTGKLGGKKTIAKLSGSKISRSGFDSSITRKAKFKAAKVVNKKLDLNSLKNKKMGKVTQTTTFSSLSVVSGSANLLFAQGTMSPPFTAGEKLFAHGVDPGAGGLLPTGNAALAPGPSFDFPTINPDSTINPTGTFGQLNTSGGLKFTKTDARPASCDDNHPVGVFIEINLVRIDLESKTASGEVVTPIGAIGRLNVGDLSGGTFTSDPNARTVSFSGLQTNLTSTSPTLLSQVFGTTAEGCNPPGTDFTGGESVGTLSATVQTQ
jgi:hypothetical protein